MDTLQFSQRGWRKEGASLQYQRVPVQRGHGRPGDTKHPCSLPRDLRPLCHQRSTQQRQAHSWALLNRPASCPVLPQVGNISSVFLKSLISTTHNSATSGQICACYYVSLTFVLDLDLLRSFWAEMISQACRDPAQGAMTFALSCWIMSLRLFILASSRLIATEKTGIWLFLERWALTCFWTEFDIQC